MNLAHIKKFSYMINAVLFLFVVFMMAFYYVSKAYIMFYFSIPTVFVYIIGFYLISRNRLYIYVRMVYFWILLYMTLGTVCVGLGFGFQLYCMSLIPVAFATCYLAHKIDAKPINARAVSFVIVTIFLLTSFFYYSYGAIYDIPGIYARVFWVCNALAVFFFLVFYSNVLVNTIIATEDKLIETAHTDSLTSLYNRHYMMNILNEVFDNEKKGCLAIADVDDFKKINDTYGHNAGDYVLMTIADIMRSTCSEATVCRWGGEEFLILDLNSTDGSLMEKLRKAVNECKFEFQNEKIKVSVTIGVSSFNHKDISNWIKDADDKLYRGKQNGKNIVVY